MSTVTAPFSFDVETLLTPISAAEPTGESLRYDAVYDLIASLRREDDPNLAQGVWKTELKKADWPQVAQTCLLAIETRSKDLQLAAWLTEAWLHLHGFAGLRQGLQVVTALCGAFWEGLHPAIQDGDIEYRLAPIQWIDEKLSVSLKLVPITNPEVDDVPAYTLSDWEMANVRQGRQRAPVDDGRVTPARFLQSTNLTLTPWIVDTADEVRRTLAAGDDLRSVLEPRCGAQTPSLATLRETLSSILSLLSNALESREEASVAPAAPGEIHDDATPVVMVTASYDVSPIRTRAEAYQRLAEAADFLARTEPHSPVPHLVRRAIKWGSLSLEELLPELVRDGHQLEEIYRTLQLGTKLQP